ncbi:MAG: TIGR00296 family protein [Candidatus Thorarchaeota archaeon]
MTYVYSDEDGGFLVRLARRAVEEYVTVGRKIEPPEDCSPHLKKESGVFVTLNSLSDTHVDLRGCIGRPYPSQPLVEATIDSAIDAAVNDPRFPPVRKGELDNLLVEISVLTPPMPIKYDDPHELLNIVKVGRDGLIVSRGMWRGLLLPQVPVEWNWSVREFLEHTCMKAGLPSNAWLDRNTKFMSFQAEIFGEVNPRGDIVRNPSHSRA